jgi:hypothetical protein
MAYRIFPAGLVVNRLGAPRRREYQVVEINED